MIADFDMLMLAFTAFNGLRLVAYVPQIVAIVRDTSGCRAVSIATYLIWLGANATTALYAWTRTGDLPLATLSAINAAYCIVIIALTIRCRSIASRTVNHFTLPG